MTVPTCREGVALRVGPQEEVALVVGPLGRPTSWGEVALRVGPPGGLPVGPSSPTRSLRVSLPRSYW